MTILEVIGWIVGALFVINGSIVVWSIWASYQFERQRDAWRDEPYEGRHVLDDE